MSARRGVMGGTFNPVHIGHLRAAEEAVEILGLETFFFIPSAVPPHKPNPRLVAFEHRWRMLELAVESNPRFRLSDMEARMPGKSYTVRTLQRLGESLPPGGRLYFLLGMDAFLELDTWWRYLELFQLARLAVLQRPGFAETEMGPFLHSKVSSDYAWDEARRCFRHPRLLPVHYPAVQGLAVSSTRIRRLTAENRSIRYLVSDAVMGYIVEHGLYGEEASHCELVQPKEENCTS